MTADDSATGSVSLGYEREGLVATVLVDRGAKLNALTLEMLADLEGHLAAIAESTARVVVLRTAGEKVFCVGADIGAFSALSPPEMWRRWIATGHRVFDRLAHLPQPTIAVVDGLAVGGGLELALACDFRLATENARFGLPETGLGTIPGWGGTGRLTRLVGTSRAKELILARRRVGSTTAMGWGLVNAVAADRSALEGELGHFVDDLLGSAPIAQQVSKQLVDAAAAGVPAAALEAIASGFTSSTQDFAEGVSGFLSRTTPRFTGS